MRCGSQLTQKLSLQQSFVIACDLKLKKGVLVLSPWLYKLCKIRLSSVSAGINYGSPC